MSDTLEKLIKDISIWKDKLSEKTKELTEKAINKGDELKNKGKQHIEYELTKRDLNKKLNEYAKYILDNYNNGITDYSMNLDFYSKSDKLIKIREHLSLLKNKKK